MDDTINSSSIVPITSQNMINTEFPETSTFVENVDGPIKDPAEVAEEDLLKELVECMESLLKLEWKRKHYSRALFSDINELKELKKEGNHYVINNYIPERQHTNYLHPVNYVLFTGQVIKAKNNDKQRWYLIKDKTGSIIVIEDIIINNVREEGQDYSSIHRNFRNSEKKYKELVAPTINDTCTLSIKGARWLLARRREEIKASPQKKPEQLVGDRLMVLGRLSDFHGERRVYARKLVCINKEQAAWIKKNLLIGRWYEDQFKPKIPESQGPCSKV